MGKALSSNPSKTTQHNGLFLLAKKGYETKDLALVETCLGKLVDLIKDSSFYNPTATYDAGILCWWLGRREEAKKWFKEASSYDMTATGAYYMLSVLFFEEKNYGETIHNAMQGDYVL